MSLGEKVMAAMKTAMKNKEKDRLTALRAIKAAILIEQTSGTAGELDEAGEIKMLQKLVKSRKESYEIYTKSGREDLAVVEKQEMDVISEFLPEAMGEEEIEATVKAVIEKVGATSMRDMGKVMGMATKELAGAADGRVVSGIVKKLLS